MESNNNTSVLKVVTVEDSLLVAERMKFMLDDVSNIEFLGNASTIPEALHLISNKKPHVVILDIHLGKDVSVTGMDLLITLRRIYPEMKIIMLTNLADSHYRETCLSYGAHYFFDKSNDFDKVPDALININYEKSTVSIFKAMDTHNQITGANNHPTRTLFYKGDLGNNNISREESEKEILRAEIKALKIANKELESFSCSVAHDLKAPLRAISGYASTMREDYGNILDDEGKQRLELIQQSICGMTTLIEGMLNFSKIGKGEIKKTVVDMAELAAETLIKINRIKQHDVNVVIHPLHPAGADRVLITQVVTNLLHNAIKYSSSVIAPEIHIRSVREDDEIIYSIKDNGAGFNMKYYDKLFCMFQRLHSSDEYEGTGVGLAISKVIIEKHGGRIWAEAEVGAGATFYFSLPTKKDMIDVE